MNQTLSSISDPTTVNRDWHLLSPAFGARLLAGIESAKKAGIQCDLFEGWRPPQRQSWLYAQGRTAPGQIVTQSEAWRSWHQFGVAGDIVFKNERGWTWDGDWAALIPHFVSKGLVSLAPRDKPHFEWTNGMSIVMADGLRKSAGVQAVWDAIGKMSGTTHGK